jgi:hypothetical protein
VQGSFDYAAPTRFARRHAALKMTTGAPGVWEGSRSSFEGLAESIVEDKSAGIFRLRRADSLRSPACCAQDDNAVGRASSLSFVLGRG